MNVLHITGDSKFLHMIQNFWQKTIWNSTFIFLCYDKKKHFNQISSNLFEISSDNFGQKKIISILNDYDIAIHYLLDYPKYKIILNSNPSIKHYWYFAGADIYQQKPIFRNIIYQPKTKAFLHKNPLIKYRIEIRTLFYLLRLKTPPIILLNRAINKLSGLLWYIEPEIKYIGTITPLPTFKPLQFFDYPDLTSPKLTPHKKIKGSIIIGNSAAVENNHLDILSYFLKITNFNPTKIIIPLSYGIFPKYKHIVKKKYSRYYEKTVEYLEDFISKDAYHTLLDSIPTAVFYNIRQLGLGNIFYLISNGTKVYLSKKCSSYQWLKDYGILVYSFDEDFERDYHNGQIELDQSIMIHNRQKLTALLTTINWQSTLIQIENESK